ncbi:MAG: hypothetical protein ACREC0_00450 [Methylocella sp.]
MANRPLIREQAFGDALDPDKLERLGRYEVHLDRKLERMLAMLLRLKDLRLRLEIRLALNGGAPNRIGLEMLPNQFIWISFRR